MSVDLMRLCWRVEFPSPAMSAVAVKLADCANDDGENVYPSVGRIERETRLGASTVRRCLAAFEEAGLLEVVAEATGNKWLRSTTIRRFNVGMLHALSAVEVRRGKVVEYYRSTHVLREVLRDGAHVWDIVERAPADSSDYPALPLPQWEGCDGPTPPAAGGAENGCPSQSGRGPLPQREGAPPGAGANTSDDKKENKIPPSPPMGGARAGSHGDAGDEGWSRGWSEAARGVVAGFRANAALAHVAASFIDPVRGTLRPQKGADPAAFVRQLAHRLRGFRPEVLARTAQVLLDTRGGYLPDAATIERAAKDIEVALRAEADAAARAARGPATPAGDPALTARWPEIRAALAATLGEQVTRSWLDGLVLLRLDAGVLTAATDAPFKARWIETHHGAALLAAARAALGPVSRVVLRAGRDAGEPAQGAAA